MFSDNGNQESDINKRNVKKKRETEKGKIKYSNTFCFLFSIRVWHHTWCYIGNEKGSSKIQ